MSSSRCQLPALEVAPQSLMPITVMPTASTARWEVQIAIYTRRSPSARENEPHTNISVPTQEFEVCVQERHQAGCDPIKPAPSGMAEIWGNATDRKLWLPT